MSTALINPDIMVCYMDGLDSVVGWDPYDLEYMTH